MEKEPVSRPTKKRRKQFADLLRKVRIELDMGQKEVDQAIGVSHGITCAYERMSKFPSFRNAQKLIEEFGLAPEDVEGMTFWDPGDNKYKRVDFD